MLLVFLKLCSISGAGYFIYLIAKEKLGKRIATMLLVLFFMYTPNVLGVLCEFDMESLAPVFLAGLYYFYIKAHWKSFMIMAVILILIKENLPLVVTVFGVHAFFTKVDKWKWGAAPLFLGVASFSLLTMVVIPSFVGHGLAAGHPYMANYRQLGRSLPEAIGCFATDPLKVFNIFATLDNGLWFFQMGFIFLFIPFLSLSTIFFISPIILQHLLSSVWNEHTIYYSYTLTIAPFIFFALIFSLERMQIFRKKKVFFMLVFFLLNFVSWAKHIEIIDYCYRPYNAREWNEARRELMAQVPRTVPVVASFQFLAPMANRAGLYGFHKVYAPEYNANGNVFRLPADVRYALVDESDYCYVKAVEMDREAVRRRVRVFLKEGGWHLIAFQGPIRLFKR